MKKLSVKIMLMILSFGLCAKDSPAMAIGGDVPKAVTAKFESRYPQAQLENWKTGKEGFTVVFKLRNKKYRAIYSGNGAWVRTEAKIKTAGDLPEAVRTALRKDKFDSWYVNRIVDVETAGGHTYYLYLDNLNTEDADLNAMKNTCLIVYDDNGQLMQERKL
ncbi:MAG TPA: hypothetical protein VF974_07115 [Patescibacteria group bacterium]